MVCNRRSAALNYFRAGYLFPSNAQKCSSNLATCVVWRNLLRRALQLCRSIQRSVSCAESLHQAMTAACTPRASTAAAVGAVSPTVQPDGLTQVLGAELAVLKDAAKALSDQLQHITQQQGQQQEYTTAAAVGFKQASQDRLDFSFSLPQLEIPPETADLVGFPSSRSSSHQQQQQQREVGLNNSRASARPSLQQQQRPSEHHPDKARPSIAVLQQQQQAVAGAPESAPDGIVQVSVTVLSQLQEAAEQHKKRCGKWKTKCKQLAQHVGALNAQLQQAQAQAAAAASAASTNDAAGPGGCNSTQVDQQQQQQAATLDELCAAVAAGQQEIRSLKQQLMQATQVKV